MIEEIYIEPSLNYDPNTYPFDFTVYSEGNSIEDAYSHIEDFVVSGDFGKIGTLFPLGIVAKQFNGNYVDENRHFLDQADFLTAQYPKDRTNCIDFGVVSRNVKTVAGKEGKQIIKMSVRHLYFFFGWTPTGLELRF